MEGTYGLCGNLFQERVVQECRGIILDTKPRRGPPAKNANRPTSSPAHDYYFDVVAWPYLKFFNFGEKYAAKLDWLSAVVMDKMDGSLCTLYW